MSLPFDVQRESKLDIRFRLFGTPVRISIWFWLGSVASGFSLIREAGVEYLLIWVLCVFLSILLHEFGHIWMGRAFGSHGEIVLQAMCGLAVGAGGQYERWKRILVSLAGPGIQLLASAILILALALVGNTGAVSFREDTTWFQKAHGWLALLSRNASRSEYVQNFFFFLLQINLFWAVLNLLPVWPLDGGQIARELFTRFSSRNGIRASLALSITTAIIICVHSGSALLGGPQIPFVPPGSFFILLLFAVLALMSFQLLQFENLRHRGYFRDSDEEDRLPWESDPDEWKRR